MCRYEVIYDCIVGARTGDSQISKIMLSRITKTKTSLLFGLVIKKKIKVEKEIGF